MVGNENQGAILDLRESVTADCNRAPYFVYLGRKLLSAQDVENSDGGGLKYIKQNNHRSCSQYIHVRRKQYTTKPTDKAAAQTASNLDVRRTFASTASQPSRKALRVKGLRKG
jgi:hypothetical protein